jgi:hypothetical protein
MDLSAAPEEVHRTVCAANVASTVLFRPHLCMRAEATDHLHLPMRIRTSMIRPHGRRMRAPRTVRSKDSRALSAASAQQGPGSSLPHIAVSASASWPESSHCDRFPETNLCSPVGLITQDSGKCLACGSHHIIMSARSNRIVLSLSVSAPIGSAAWRIGAASASICRPLAPKVACTAWRSAKVDACRRLPTSIWRALRRPSMAETIALVRRRLAAPLMTESICLRPRSTTA